MTSIAKTYEPKGFEKIITELWESAGAFRADAFSDKPAFNGPSAGGNRIGWLCSEKATGRIPKTGI